MATILNRQMEKARIEPETVFSRPLDIVTDQGLTREQKFATLERWNLALQDRLRATGEGMAPRPGETAAEAALIEEIGDALRKLQNDTGTVPAADG